ncbi:amino-acid N-acetyltransferase [Mucilaginibacter sp. UYP25]|uniref:arsenic resistance N-acetyltransferase ArsN2 n=1 Tax=unclassified Mucilaginibacter TaxID=2617802 RepID=UPI003398137D
MNTEIKPAQPYRNEVINLLTSTILPTGDLPDTLENFFVSVQDNRVVGVAGLEIYDEYGLLRSLAVNELYRNKAIGAQLLSRIEALASETGLKAIYLLTETAKDYFENKGYEHIARMDIPDPVKRSSEFTQVCPESATAMQKSL